MGVWDYGIMGLWDYGIMGVWEYGSMGMKNNIPFLKLIINKFNSYSERKLDI